MLLNEKFLKLQIKKKGKERKEGRKRERNYSNKIMPIDITRKV